MTNSKGKRLDGGKKVAPDVRTGDRILFGKYSGNEIELDAHYSMPTIRNQAAPAAASTQAASTQAASTRKVDVSS